MLIAGLALIVLSLVSEGPLASFLFGGAGGALVVEWFFMRR